MAQEESARSFTTTTSGGGNPYSAAFLGANSLRSSGEEGGYSEAGSKKMRDVLDYAQFLQSSEKADWEQNHRARMDAHQVEMERMAQRRADLELERQNRAEKLAIHNEELENAAGALGASLYMLDPNRPDYMDKKKELLADPANHQALNSRFGKQIVDTMNYQDTRHNNMIEWWNSKSKESGHEGSFYNAPRTKDGDIDFKASQALFDTASQQLAERQKAEMQAKEAELLNQGLVKKRVSFDSETGKQKFEYTPKTETGVKEITAKARALDADFKRDFGSGHGPDVLGYGIGYKDARGYTLTRGTLRDGKKFVEDPTGNAVKIHDAMHPKNDKVIAIDTFNQYKRDYSDLKKEAQGIRAQYPGLLEQEARGQEAPSGEAKPSVEGGTETQKVEEKKAVRSALSNITKISSRINDLRNEIDYLKKNFGEENAAEGIAQRADEISALESEMAGMQAGLQESGKSEIAKMRKTSSLSERSGQDTSIDWSKYSK